MGQVIDTYHLRPLLIASIMAMLHLSDVTADDLFVSNNAALKANGTGYLELGNTNSGVIQVGGDGTDSTIAPRFNNLKIQHQEMLMI